MSNSVTIAPGYRGAATIRDRDILIFALSRAIERYNQTNKLERKVRVPLCEFLRVTGCDTEGLAAQDHAYAYLSDALFRLGSTSVVIHGASEGTFVGGWIDNYRIWRTKEEPEMAGEIEIGLTNVMCRAIETRGVLPLNQEYFDPH
jgi:plasmid replication initiation protein